MAAYLVDECELRSYGKFVSCTPSGCRRESAVGVVFDLLLVELRL
jgi:hypothetical protein